MKLLILITVIALLASFISDRHKTGRALIVAWTRLKHIAPAFFIMLIFISIILTVFPENMISNLLGKHDLFLGVTFASMIGSLVLMPGFIAFPLCGILLRQGVPYTTLSALTTTMMMVGILTFPLEQSYFGTRTAVIRNTLCFLIAMIVALLTGLFYGEIL